VHSRYIHRSSALPEGPLGIFHPCLWSLKAAGSTFGRRVAKPLVSSLTPVPPEAPLKLNYPVHKKITKLHINRLFSPNICLQRFDTAGRARGITHPACKYTASAIPQHQTKTLNSDGWRLDKNSVLLLSCAELIDNLTWSACPYPPTNIFRIKKTKNCYSSVCQLCWFGKARVVSDL